MRHHGTLLLVGVIWQYVHSVATNIAYYIHTPRTPLRDLGFLMFPPLSTQMQVISEIFFFLLVTVTLTFVMSPFFKPALWSQSGGFLPSMEIQSRVGGKGVSAGSIDSDRLVSADSPENLVELPHFPGGSISSRSTSGRSRSLQQPQSGDDSSRPLLFTFMMLTRFTKVVIIAQTLRCIAFLTTSLPGPNYHCRPGAPDYAPPDGWFEIFARQDAFKGCGDLVFSSHTIFLVLCALVIQKYSSNQRMKRTVWVLVGVFAMFCVAARKHYTLDIVVACYTVPLVWIVLDKFSPDKLPPKLVALLEQERKLRQLAETDVDLLLDGDSPSMCDNGGVGGGDSHSPPMSVMITMPGGGGGGGGARP